MSFPNIQSDAAGAIPVYLTAGAGSTTFTDYSVDITAAGVAEVVALAQPTRKYLFIQPLTVGVWVNVTGGNAQADEIGSFYIAPLQRYETTMFAPTGRISMLSSGTPAVTITIGT